MPASKSSMYSCCYRAACSTSSSVTACLFLMSEWSPPWFHMHWSPSVPWEACQGSPSSLLNVTAFMRSESYNLWVTCESHKSGLFGHICWISKANKKSKATSPIGRGHSDIRNTWLSITVNWRIPCSALICYHWYYGRGDWVSFWQCEFVRNEGNAGSYSQIPKVSRLWHTCTIPFTLLLAITAPEKFEKNFLHTLTMGNLAQKGIVYGMLLWHFIT